VSQRKGFSIFKDNSFSSVTCGKMNNRNVFIMNSYDEKNMGIIDNQALHRLKQMRILIVGMGGIGGHVANHLVRLGVHSVHLCDFDVFEASNINRQLFATQDVLGLPKVSCVKKAVENIRPDVDIVIHHCRIEQLDAKVFQRIDIIMDALDSIKSKLYLEEVATNHKLPLFHGALGGWFGQIGIAMPNSKLLSRFYENADHGLEASLGAPTFTPSIIAGMMVSELLKFIAQPEHALINRILSVNLLNHEYDILFK
jgi:molybdopterin/thiamine biosynthesis adenylyltransferase